MSNADQIRGHVVRIDHKFNDKWAILGHYMEDKVTQGYAQPELGWDVGELQHGHQLLRSTRRIRRHQAERHHHPNLLVEASMNYDGNVINILNSQLAISLRLEREPFFNNGQPRSAEHRGGWGAPYGTRRRNGIGAVA